MHHEYKEKNCCNSGISYLNVLERKSDYYQNQAKYNRFFQRIGGKALWLFFKDVNVNFY